MSDLFYRALVHGLPAAADCLRDMDMVHRSALWVILAVFIWFFIRSLRGMMLKKSELLWSTLSGAFVCLLLLCIVIADAAGTLVFLPSDTPEHTVMHFMDSFLARDNEVAMADLSTPRQLFSAPEDVDDTGALYYAALRRSYSYSLIGSAQTAGTGARVKLRFSYLKLDALLDPIEERVNATLKTTVESRPKREVFDENDAYLPEVLDKLYRDAVLAELFDAQKYYTSEDVELKLEYVDGRWYITPDDKLLLCFSGGRYDGEMFANNARAEVLSELTYIPKLYVIAEDVDVPPAPDPGKYGATTDPAEIKALLEEYSRVTGIDEPFWREDITLLQGKFNYYADETIVFVAWREIYGGKNCTFADVYIADPSQLRRKLSGDAYGSNIHKPATELAKEANAVIALNGDFYKHRPWGITAYKRELYRFNPYKLELCHMDSQGNMHFTYAGELKEKEDAEKYIAENDIVFSLAFGPVLVENYEEHNAGAGYPLGEVNEHYSRSALGQRGSGHYLLMNINPGWGTGSATIADARRIMQNMGVERAYAMDGGQTAEIVFNGKFFNPIDYGNERMVSDIIYFATALPEDENK